MIFQLGIFDSRKTCNKSENLVENPKNAKNKDSLFLHLSVCRVFWNRIYAHFSPAVQLSRREQMFTHFHNRHIPVLPLLNWTHQSSLLSTRRNWKSHAADGKLCYQMGTIPTHHHTAKNFKLQKLFKQLFLYRGQHCFDWRFPRMKCHLQRLCNSISIGSLIQTF